jgi:hypothetical protein
VLRRGVEQHAHAAARVVELAIVGVKDGRGPGGWRREAADHPQGGGLARAVGAEEAGHGAWLAAERDVVHGELGAVALGQVIYVDHAASIGAGGGSVHPPMGDAVPTKVDAGIDLRRCHSPARAPTLAA